jgi:ATP-dependent DNA ligase
MFDFDLQTMEARLVRELPPGPGWQFEPKWDGFRCLAFRDGDRIELKAKSGKSLARFFPEVVAMLQKLPAQKFIIDGELTVPMGEELSFDALQMHLHPAESRIRKLSRETPARFVLFDCLYTPTDKNLVEQPLTVRRDALERFFASLDAPRALVLTPYTRDRNEAERWLARAGGSLDGVVAKRADGPYVPGERAMLKIKHLRTADCVVGGFRYGNDSKQVASLLLGLYNDDGQLDHVGFTSSIHNTDRAALTRKLKKLRATPGFTGKAPGAPSRWTTERSSEWEPLEPELVVEVCYDHVSEHRFRHGTKLLRWRPDKAPSQCTFEQLERDARPSKLIKKIAKPRGRSSTHFDRRLAGSI